MIVSDEPMTDIDHTPLVEEEGKQDHSLPSKDAKEDQTDENGYQWLLQEGVQWYRKEDGSEWSEYQE